MKSEILQNIPEVSKESDAYKLSKAIFLANKNMSRDTDPLTDPEIKRKFPLRYRGRYCGMDIDFFILNPKLRDVNDAIIGSDGKPAQTKAHLFTYDSNNNKSSLYTYAGYKLYIRETVSRQNLCGQSIQVFGEPEEVKGPLAQMYNNMLEDVHKPRIRR